MGAVLAAGAWGSLRDKSYGLPLIGAFLCLYALLFIDFQTINPKIIHLTVCALLFGVLLLVRKSPSELMRSSLA